MSDQQLRERVDGFVNYLNVMGGRVDAHRVADFLTKILQETRGDFQSAPTVGDKP